ncbi:hypothetical protein V6N13_041365 [Hibiscus sabdariffa]
MMAQGSTQRRVVITCFWMNMILRLDESVEHLMTDCNFALQLFHSLGLLDVLPSEDVSWKEWSPESVVKFNFDSVFNFQAKIATSWVLGRNANSLITVACLVSHRDMADAFIAEALACKQAVMFARDLDFSSVIIEGGSLTVMKKLNASSSDKSIISPIVHDIYCEGF